MQPWQAAPATELSTKDTDPDVLYQDDIDRIWTIDLKACTSNITERITALGLDTPHPNFKAFVEAIHIIIEKLHNAKLQDHCLVVQIRSQFTEFQEMFKFSDSQTPSERPGFAT